MTVPAARVVPNVPTFPVDGGFWYSVPDRLADLLEIGSIVRVPLGGRRVRGWVVELGVGDPDALKEISGVSGSQPVFDGPLFESLRWAASHYVAPVSVLLAKATPPNLPKSTPQSDLSSRSSDEGQSLPVGRRAHPLRAVALDVAAGRKRPTQAMLGRWQSLEWLPALSPLFHAGRSALVIAGSAAEVVSIGSQAREGLSVPVIEVAGGVDAELTRAWERAQAPGTLIVGTPRTATWSIASLGLVVVLEEGRRSMKDRQTPTLHVREVIRRRSLLEGFTTVFFGPTPSVEILATGAETTMVANRAWPLVEIVDRSLEPPGSGLLAPAVSAALKAITDSGQRSFLHTTHRMVDEVIKEANARLGAPSAGVAGSGRPITVGTERDIAGLQPVSLVVAANPDGMMLGRGYRTSEETLRVLARVANALKAGSGHRMMVQTMDVNSDLAEALRKGDPLPYLERVLVERSRGGLPPSTEMVAVEIRGEIPEGVAGQLSSIEGAIVVGPVEVESGRRWLLQGDLAPARRTLRKMATAWRGAGATLRIDVDPIDL
ncbi:MAG: hypothetical protein U9N56_05220 [Actinomycetota bacterium]|nr:hypothetical protein [Actinomycetota bacterium]